MVYGVLGVTLVLLQVIIMFFVSYQVIISLAGMLKSSKSRTDIPPAQHHHRFAVLVCAHNEETVVGQIVQNLNKLDYPKDRYDVMVICDNCSDNTADVVRANGAIAMERINPYKKGKGHALEWMFDNLWVMEYKGNAYDAVVVLDADNLVNAQFLTIANAKLHEGHEVVQAYLDSKNPSDNWITKSYAYSYWSTNRIYQLARQSIGLSAQLGGTGMILRTSVLKEMGWGSTSLTEDLEFTARYVLKTGKGIGWAHDAIIYDEKPLGFKQSFRQRVRWMQGHLDCLYRYTLPLMKAFIKERNIRHLDVAIYLVQPSRILLCGIPLGLTALSFLHLFPEQLSGYMINSWWWVSVLTAYYLITVLGAVLEGKLKYSLWFFWTYMFGLTWVPVLWRAVVNVNNKEWTHTKHTRTLTEDEVKQMGV